MQRKPSCSVLYPQKYISVPSHVALDICTHPSLASRLPASRLQISSRHLQYGIAATTILDPLSTFLTVHWTGISFGGSNTTLSDPWVDQCKENAGIASFLPRRLFLEVRKLEVEVCAQQKLGILVFSCVYV